MIGKTEKNQLALGIESIVKNRAITDLWKWIHITGRKGFLSSRLSLHIALLFHVSHVSSIKDCYYNSCFEVVHFWLIKSKWIFNLIFEFVINHCCLYVYLCFFRRNNACLTFGFVIAKIKYLYIVLYIDGFE